MTRQTDKHTMKSQNLPPITKPIPSLPFISPFPPFPSPSLPNSNPLRGIRFPFCDNGSSVLQPSLLYVLMIPLRLCPSPYQTRIKPFIVFQICVYYISCLFPHYVYKLYLFIYLFTNLFMLTCLFILFTYLSIFLLFIVSYGAFPLLSTSLFLFTLLLVSLVCYSMYLFLIVLNEYCFVFHTYAARFPSFLSFSLCMSLLSLPL